MLARGFTICDRSLAGPTSILEKNFRDGFYGRMIRGPPGVGGAVGGPSTFRILPSE